MTAVIATALVAGSAAAHPRVFVGFGYPGYGWGYPYYGYPYGYQYGAPFAYPYTYAYPYPYPAHPVIGPYSTPPLGWSPGHWEKHEDSSGREIDVWVPEHLQ